MTIYNEHLLDSVNSLLELDDKVADNNLDYMEKQIAQLDIIKMIHSLSPSCSAETISKAMNYLRDYNGIVPKLLDTAYLNAHSGNLSQMIDYVQYIDDTMIQFDRELATKYMINMKLRIVEYLTSNQLSWVASLVRDTHFEGENHKLLEDSRVLGQYTNSFICTSEIYLVVPSRQYCKIRMPKLEGKQFRFPRNTKGVVDTPVQTETHK